jgi:hypothetical protein
MAVGAAGAAVLRVAARMTSHARAVNALSMSVDAEHLVSASDDGSAIVWDLRSRQPVRTIQSPAKVPITGLLVLPTPTHLVPSGGGSAESSSARGGSRQGPKRLQPLAPLTKYTGMQGSVQSWESSPIVLDGSALDLLGAGAGAAGLQALGGVSSVASVLAAHRNPQHSHVLGPAAGAGAGTSVERPAEAMSDAGAGPSGDARVAALEAELAFAKKQAAEYKALHAQLLAFASTSLAGTA